MPGLSTVTESDEISQTRRRLDAVRQRLDNLNDYIRQLESQVFTDMLTGLLNRRGFDRFFAVEQQRLRRKLSPGALLILIDVDRFKAVNDTHGHLVGDACLKLLGQTLSAAVRVLDGPARIGGDEFAIVLAQIAPDAAVKKLERVRALLEDLRLETPKGEIRFSASLGAATITDERKYSDIYKEADLNLYAHKARRKAG